MQTEQILESVKQMSLPELEEFVEQVIAIKASKHAPHLPEDEYLLFEKINSTFPLGRKFRLNELTQKRDQSFISQQEYEELAKLTDEIELFQAERVKALVSLAELRGTTLNSIMKQLGVNFPDHG